MTVHDEDAYRDDLDDENDRRLRALGTRSPRCSVPGCPERDPFALTGAHPAILCREHSADQQGRSWTEEHHLAGHANNPEHAAVPANDHGTLSAYQQLWDRETLRNPDGSPLLRAAAALRGWLDLMRIMITRTVGWIPEFLERLDAALRAAIGPAWWERLGCSL